MNLHRIVKRSRSGDNDDKTSKKKDIEMESLSFAGAVVPKDSSENIIDFDKLVLEEKVGEGSFGVVYKGKYGDSIVAIKKVLLSNMSICVVIHFFLSFSCFFFL